MSIRCRSLAEEAPCKDFVLVMDAVPDTLAPQDKWERSLAVAFQEWGDGAPAEGAAERALLGGA